MALVRVKTKEEQLERDQEFFQLYLKTGSAKEAAALLGLASPTTAGYEYKKRVLANIESHTHKALTSAVPTALATLMELVKESKNDRVKLDAAKTVLEFSGFKPPEKSIVITRNMTAEELDKELKKLLEGHIIDS